MDLDKLLLEENVGGLDLWIRAVFGSAAIVVLAMDLVSGLWAWIIGFIAFTGLFTSITRHCMPYALIGYSTAKKK